MKFKLDTILKYTKVLKALHDEECNYLYLDVLNDRMYYVNTGSTIAAQLIVHFEETEDSNPVFVINKEELMHIASFSDEITLNNDYSYKTKRSKGVFSKRPEFEKVLDSISFRFNHEEGFETLFTIDDEILGKMQRANYFISPDDRVSSYQTAQVIDGELCSASMMRIFSCVLPEVEDTILHSNVMKFLLTLGKDTKVTYDDKCFFLSKEEIKLYFTKIEEVAKFTVKEPAYMQSIATVQDGECYKFNVAKLKEALNFITFYATSAQSITRWVFEDNKLKFKVGDNAFEVESEIKKGLFLDFYFNSDQLLQIINKLSSGKDGETMMIYSGDNNNPVRVLVLDFETMDEVIVTKLNTSM